TTIPSLPPAGTSATAITMSNLTKTSALKNSELKQFRAIAHKLNPVVMVGSHGISDGVIGELDRALHDHELIKLKIAVGDRDLRDTLLAELCDRAGATLVQRIGNTATLLRRSATPDPRKSNLLRTL
ncbi:MAG: YhbY family RNA-binding protein, partial [Burkholderiaceae bacterium]